MIIQNNIAGKFISIGCAHIISKCAILAAEHQLNEILSDQPMSIAEMAKKLNFTIEGTTKLIRVLDALGLVILKRDLITASELTPHLDYFLGIHIADGYGAIEQLEATLKGEGSAWQAHYGKTFYQYLDSNSEKSQAFTDWCEKTANTWLAAILPLYDFRPYNTIIDMAGGNGKLLSMILADNPNARGILFELPSVIEQTKKLWAESEISKRLSYYPGDFFVSAPTEGELYIISRALLNWNDADAIRIINQCYDHMPQGSKLLVIDFFLPEKSHTAYFDFALSDLNLHGIWLSSNRTKQEWIDLLKNTHFHSHFIYSSTEGSLSSLPICLLEATK
jgi:O-methyltransferase domain